MTLSVLHVIARMPRSGTELQLAETLMTAVQLRLWRPTLYVLYPNFPISAELASAGVSVVEGAEREPSVLRALGLRQFARAGNYNVVHSSLWGSNILTRAALVGPNRPSVVISERRVEEYRGQTKRFVDRRLRRLTDAYVGNSEDVVRFIRAAHTVSAQRVYRVHNGVDQRVFYKVDACPPDSGDVLKVGALGRLTHQKGFDVLIRAVSEAAPRRKLRLVIAGDGELRTELELMAQGLPVTFVGHLADRNMVANFLRDLDVFVMPSRYEGLPNAVLEARACGIPVIATEAPGIAEAADEGTRLVPVGDYSILADTLVEFASGSSPDVAVTSFDEVAREHLDIFKVAVKNRVGGGHQ